MSKQQTKRKKRLLFWLVTIIILVISSIVIQKYFMPKWEDGNTNHPQPSEVGVHEQINSGENDSEKTVSVF